MKNQKNDFTQTRSKIIQKNLLLFLNWNKVSECKGIREILWKCVKSRIIVQKCNNLYRNKTFCHLIIIGYSMIWGRNNIKKIRSIYNWCLKHRFLLKILLHVRKIKGLQILKIIKRYVFLYFPSPSGNPISIRSNWTEIFCATFKGNHTVYTNTYMIFYRTFFDILKYIFFHPINQKHKIRLKVRPGYTIDTSVLTVSLHHSSNDFTTCVAVLIRSNITLVHYN